MSDPIRVLIIDDHPLFRDGVAASLESEPGISVVGTGGSGAEALALARGLEPEIMLLDVAMTGMDGLAVLDEISVAAPSIKVVMLTVSEDGSDVHRAMDRGACGYVLKGVSATELARAVRDVAGGHIYVTPSLGGTILSELVRHPRDDRFADLTERELDVLRLVGKGMTNKEIAGNLVLADKTVKFHMTNILRKLHVRNRVEAALLVQQEDPDARSSPARRGSA